MDNHKYYISSAKEYFAEAFKSYCENEYVFLFSATESVESIPKTMDYINSLIQ